MLYAVKLKSLVTAAIPDPPVLDPPPPILKRSFYYIRHLSSGIGRVIIFFHLDTN